MPWRSRQPVSIPNLPEGERIRRLVQSIREARFKKTAEGLKSIDGTALKINLLSFMEINEIRPFLLMSLDHAARLSLLEHLEHQSGAPAYNAKDGMLDAAGKAYDGSQPVYSSADANPYSEAYNPYAFSTSQQ